jgi:hypothetical protein
VKGPPDWLIVAAAGAGFLVLTRYAPAIGGGYSNPIKAFAAAIARAEGFTISNSIPARAHNPGNLAIPGWTGETIGAEGISVFGSDAEGWERLYRQLQLIVDGRSLYSLDWSIAQMGDRWAPAATNPGGYWARNVAAALGVPTSTRLRDVLT